MHRLRLATPVLILAVTGALVTACGGSTTAPTATPASTPTATPTATAAGGGGSGSFCQQSNAVLTQIAQVVASMRSPGANTLAGIKGEIAALTQALDNGDGTAPSAIAAAIHTMRVAYDQINPGVQAATSTLMLAPAFAAGETTAVKDAGDQVTAYYQANCH